MKYDVSVVGFGDNVVDIYTHENVQYPGGCSALMVIGFGIRDSINQMVKLQFT